MIWNEAIDYPIKYMSFQTKTKSHGLALIEVLVVMSIVICLAVLISNTLRKKKYATAVAALECIDNLKQTGLGLTLYAQDNNGKFPLQIVVTNSGIARPIYPNHAFPCYQVASNELGNYPKILICPFDITRQAAASFEMLSETNVSYLFNADAVRDSSTNSILSGDRFLECDGHPVNSGLFILTTNLNMSWTPSLHRGDGNVTWSDGSVQQTTSAGLHSIVQNQFLATNHFLIP